MQGNICKGTETRDRIVENENQVEQNKIPILITYFGSENESQENEALVN